MKELAKQVQMLQRVYIPWSTKAARKHGVSTKDGLKMITEITVIGNKSQIKLTWRLKIIEDLRLHEKYNTVKNCK